MTEMVASVLWAAVGANVVQSVDGQRRTQSLCTDKRRAFFSVASNYREGLMLKRPHEVGRARTNILQILQYFVAVVLTGVLQEYEALTTTAEHFNENRRRIDVGSSVCITNVCRPSNIKRAYNEPERMH